ncbi:MAG: pyruvate kinase [Candidatus Peregrinibacteria bacterium]|nr:pyruvate kinase [Candidatus Peregrinibacteria bacterium]MDZ4244869.1 pyruvate kinase [Candidatus Gracilibacteria bacterium]
MLKNTKIVATLGPSSDDCTTITKMVQAGMNVARLNFSHGTHENHEMLLNNVRTVSKKLGVPIAIIQDLQGPKIRIAKLKEPIQIKKGQIVIINTKNETKENNIPIQYKGLPSEVKAGSTIFINDGLLELKVLKTNKKDRIECKVVCGGIVESNKGMNVIDGFLKAATLTAKDKKDLAWGIKHKVDFVALSFVKEASDIISLKKRLEGTGIKVISKIERREAVEDETLEGIIIASDAIMVARGDLGVEVRPEYVPILQKRMIHLANKHARPVITATQMMQSMIENPTPTRAEVSDVANAILDHTDAIMLSNETSTGPYPLKAIQIMKRISHVVEDEMARHELFVPNKMYNIGETCALAYAGVSIACDMNADAIIVITETGESALQVAKMRPLKNNFVFTKNEKTKNQLALVWGVNRIFCIKDFAKLNAKEIVKILKKEKLSHKGQKVVIINTQKNSNKIETIII